MTRVEARRGWRRDGEDEWMLLPLVTYETTFLPRLGGGRATRLALPATGVPSLFHPNPTAYPTSSHVTMSAPICAMCQVDGRLESDSNGTRYHSSVYDVSTLLGVIQRRSGELVRTHILLFTLRIIGHCLDVLCLLYLLSLLGHRVACACCAALLGLPLLLLRRFLFLDCLFSRLVARLERRTFLWDELLELRRRCQTALLEEDLAETNYSIVIQVFDDTNLLANALRAPRVVKDSAIKPDITFSHPNHDLLPLLRSQCLLSVVGTVPDLFVCIGARPEPHFRDTFIYKLELSCQDVGELTVVIIDEGFPCEELVTSQRSINQDLELLVGKLRLVCIFGPRFKEGTVFGITAVGGDGSAELLCLAGCVILCKL